MTTYWDKAMAAGKSAHLLFEAADFDGAVNRAYYAMFDAARAGLELLDKDLAVAKTHDTIIRRFGEHLVLKEGLDRSLGRALNAAEVVRIAADYQTVFTTQLEAKDILDRMDRFLAVIEHFLKSRAAP